MGFKLNVTGGADAILIGEKSITNVEFYSNSPNDSNARATDFSLSAKVWGRILYKVGAGDMDMTLNLARWSQMPSERTECYRVVAIDVLSAGQMVRRITFPNAFVVEYYEESDDESGVGNFYLHIKQKKDENEKVLVEGGYSA